MRKADYYVLDLELTHSSYLIEIGVTHVYGEVLTTFFHTLVQPHVDLDKHVSVLTGITAAMLKDAPPEEECLIHFIACFSEVQHPNILVWGEDEKILRKVANRYKMTHLLKDFVFYDLRNLLPFLRFWCGDIVPTNKNSLWAVAQSLGITQEDQAHRALDDAWITSKVMSLLMGRLLNIS